MHATDGRSARCRGFTLVELLVVIGIIILLVSILVPVVGRLRQAGMNATGLSFMNQLSRAIEAYEADFRQYPGPLSNAEVWNLTVPANKIQLDPALVTDPNTPYADQLGLAQKITMAENLVLGLLGGLRFDQNLAPGELRYDPRLIGSGPRDLRAGGKSYKPYIEAVNLSWRQTSDTGTVPQPLESPADRKTGHFRDEADPAGADDSIIPEFLDPFPDPLPILYLRAKRGAQARSGTIGGDNNSIVTYHETDTNNRVGQYDLHQIMAYVDSSIGVGRASIKPEGWNNPKVHGLRASAADKVQPFASMTRDNTLAIMKYTYPFNAYPYFRNKALSSPKDNDPEFANLGSPRNDIPHQKDGYILIGAGIDRIYGTLDDMTNFGAVGQ